MEARGKVGKIVSLFRELYPLVGSSYQFVGSAYNVPRYVAMVQVQRILSHRCTVKR